jgi:hypothetical protein
VTGEVVPFPTPRLAHPSLGVPDLADLSIAELTLLLDDWPAVVDALDPFERAALVDDPGFWVRPDGSDVRVLLDAGS